MQKTVKCNFTSNNFFESIIVFNDFLNILIIEFTLNYSKKSDAL